MQLKNLCPSAHGKCSFSLKVCRFKPRFHNIHIFHSFTADSMTFMERKQYLIKKRNRFGRWRLTWRLTLTRLAQGTALNSYFGFSLNLFSGELWKSGEPKGGESTFEVENGKRKRKLLTLITFLANYVKENDWANGLRHVSVQRCCIITRNIKIDSAFCLWIKAVQILKR